MIPLPRMTYNEVGQTFILLGRAENSLAFGKVVATLHFKVKEIDPSTGAQPGLLRAAPCLAAGTPHRPWLSWGGCRRSRGGRVQRRVPAGGL